MKMTLLLRLVSLFFICTQTKGGAVIRSLYDNGNLTLNESSFGHTEDSNEPSMQMNPSAYKLKNKWGNTTVRVICRRLPPYVNDDYSGIEQNILKIVLDYLGIQNLSHIEGTTYQYEKNMATGNHTNPAFLSLQFDKADIAVGAFHPTVNTYNDFEGSIVYIIDKLTLILPNLLTEESVWSRVKQIYSWKFCLVSIMCLAVILLIIHNFFNPTKMSLLNTIALYLQWFFQIIIESSIHRLHKLCNFRLVIISLLSFCLIHSTAFKNTLELIYFNERYSMGTTEENLNLYVPYSPSSGSSSTEPVNDSYSNLIRKLQLCSSVIKCLDHIAVFKDHEILFLATPVIYSIPKYYTDKWSYQPLLVIDRTFQLVPIHMLFRKNYSAFQDINVVLRRLFENGIIQLELTNVERKWHLQVSKLKIKLKSRVLTVDHLEFAFLLWSVGLSLGISVFMVEITIYCIVKNN